MGSEEKKQNFYLLTVSQGTDQKTIIQCVLQQYKQIKSIRSVSSKATKSQMLKEKRGTFFLHIPATELLQQFFSATIPWGLKKKLKSFFIIIKEFYLTISEIQLTRTKWPIANAQDFWITLFRSVRPLSKALISLPMRNKREKSDTYYSALFQGSQNRNVWFMLQQYRSLDLNLYYLTSFTNYKTSQLT